MEARIVGDGLGQGVRVEDMVHVTKTGYELLSRWPIDEIIECPYYGAESEGKGITSSFLLRVIPTPPKEFF